MTGYKTSELHMDQATSLLEHILLAANPNAYFPFLLSQKNSAFVQIPAPQGR